MSLWFRLIRVLIFSLFRKPMRLLEGSRLRFIVWPLDLDLNVHMTNARYFAIADLGRIDFVIRTGLAAAAWKLRGRPIVADAMAKFRKDLRPFQRFELETQLLGWDDKRAFIIHRFIRRGRIVGVVVVRTLFANDQGALTPQQMLDVTQSREVSPPLPDWIVAWSNACDALAADIRTGEGRSPEPAAAAFSAAD